MKALFFICLFTARFINVYSQENYQKEIDQTVWKPFAKYFENYETHKFMMLHDSTLIRVEIDRNRVFDYRNYYKINLKTDSVQKTNNTNRTIEFKFTRRIANNSNAFEEGYYRTISIRLENNKVFTGKFWVTLKKKNGIWKLTMDADTSEGITEKVYNMISPKDPK
jgi:outer membrane translocation and assembly module TamA